MARARERALYRQRGRCPWCGKPRETGKRHCARCGVYNRAYQRERYAQLCQDGVCVQCARAEAVYPHVRCETCRAYMREYHRRYQRRGG